MLLRGSCLSLQHQQNLYPSDKIFLSRQLRAEHLTNRQVKRANKIVDQGRPLVGGSVTLWAWVL